MSGHLYLPAIPFTILHSIAQYISLQFKCTRLYCTGLQCTTLRYTALQSTTMYYAALHYSTLPCLPAIKPFRRWDPECGDTSMHCHGDDDDDDNGDDNDGDNDDYDDA